MRCYHFGNMYLSSIQQGIQAAHAQMELFNKYVPKTDTDAVSDELFTQLFDWSINHKTMICLNAGYLETMIELYNFIDTEENPYPYSKFQEGEEALGGILTNVAIVLPEHIYVAIKYLNDKKVFFNKNNYLCINDKDKTEDEKLKSFILTQKQYTNFDIDLINRIKQFKLAI